MLRLGVVGLSPGNGHPYSWSAIFNGYNPVAMAECPFPAIPAYLARQAFPHDAIPGAQVTHVWTQERQVSEHIARAANIPNVVTDPIDLIGQVDAILLARDDAEQHLAMASPFLLAGLPIYIDKPVAYDLATLRELYTRRQFEGQIFTCSALAYAKEFLLAPEDLAALGPLRHVDAVVMKGWPKYGIHIVEPVLGLIGDQGPLCRVEAKESDGEHVVTAAWASGLTATFTATGERPTPIAISLLGDASSRELVFGDAYCAFKRALEAFVAGIADRRGTPLPQAARVVELIERGCHAS